MYPILFSYEFISIGSYGLMLGLAFYLGFLLLERELKLAGKNPDMAYNILIIAIVGGIVGAKVFHILEYPGEFINDPTGMIFSGAGLSVMGGYLFAFLGAYVAIRYMKESFLQIADLASPGLSLGYAIGRIGCHVSGDGCYGVASSSWIATSYPNGIVPISTTVLPTPLFESLGAFLITALLLSLGRRELPTGLRFFLYLTLSGLARFIVEFVRRNPEFLAGLSQAQIVGILFTLAGIAGMFLSLQRWKRA